MWYFYDTKCWPMLSHLHWEFRSLSRSQKCDQSKCVINIILKLAKNRHSFIIITNFNIMTHKCMRIQNGTTIRIFIIILPSQVTQTEWLSQSQICLQYKCGMKNNLRSTKNNHQRDNFAILTTSCSSSGETWSGRWRSWTCWRARSFCSCTRRTTTGGARCASSLNSKTLIIIRIRIGRYQCQSFTTVALNRCNIINSSYTGVFP